MVYQGITTGIRLNVIDQLHTSTKRKYIERMNNNKIFCMKKAREFEKDFWDGDRQFGYGGYIYDGRWEDTAKKLIKQYNLNKDSKILDLGCGKGFLLYEIFKLTNCKVMGQDISSYAINNAKNEIKDNLSIFDVRKNLQFSDNEFDLVLSINTFHNFQIFDLKNSIQEMERVGKNKLLIVEAYDTEDQLFNLQCWALTAESFFTTKEWEWLYKEYNYNGDYDFIYFN